ncbi:MAG: metal ABC transporter ATP-binding protein [Candidatus Omnitrophica bacterium]|nr:metal ABC transporter ATP-binding protein [Candidatus Omnitrophota bacterium]
MNKAIVEVKNLSVFYNGQTVLSDLNFSIKKGEIVAIVGPNGSGKTTLIRAILGLVPYQGQILVNREAVQGSLEKIGYVPQRFSFDRTIPITVGEFLKIAFRKVAIRRLKHALLEVDMKEHEHAPLGSLSGGQFQRVLIARSLLNDPTLLLLDEATSEVDIGGAKSFYEIVAHLNRVHQTTVMLVSHEINMVYQFADQIICLNRQLICFGKPKEAITKEVLEKLYGQEVRFQEHRH